jgi:hypothetical protein
MDPRQLKQYACTILTEKIELTKPMKYDIIIHINKGDCATIGITAYIAQYLLLDPFMELVKDKPCFYLGLVGLCFCKLFIFT